ncbi:hypothetical protein CHUAL_014203 [Chamberlinius hualienensis]
MAKIRLVILWMSMLLLASSSGVKHCNYSDNFGEMELKDCNAVIKNNKTEFNLRCTGLIRFEDGNRKSFNTKFGIMTTYIFKSLMVPSTSILSGSGSSCLRLTENYLKLIVPPVKKSPNEWYFEEVEFTLLEYVAVFEAKTTFSHSGEFGEVFYNGSCINQIDAIDNRIHDDQLEVSKCITMVKIRYFVKELISSLTLATITGGDDEDFIVTHLGAVVDITKITTKSFLYQIPSSFLKSLSRYKLQNLYYPNNYLVTIRNNYFPSIPTLKLLDLSFCRVTSLEKYAFRNLPNLIHLNLAGNHIQMLDEAVWSLPQLIYLNFSFNYNPNEKFNCSPFSVGHLSSLKYLDLSNLNLLTNLSSKAPTGISMPYLKMLNLSNTSIHEFPAIFDNFVSDLEELILSDNEFTNNFSIKSLLKRKRWPQLHSIDLSRCFKFRIDYNFVYNYFPKLRTLKLAGNEISEINFLYNKHQLSYVDLSNNKITKWSQIVFDGELVRNVSLKLTGNTIKEVTPAMLEDFDKFRDVDISENPFDCSSCYLRDFQNWLKNYVNKSKIRIETYKCADDGQILIEAYFNSELCRNKVLYWFVRGGIPAIVTITIIFGVLCIMSLDIIGICGTFGTYSEQDGI